MKEAEKAIGMSEKKGLTYVRWSWLRHDLYSLREKGLTP